MKKTATLSLLLLSLLVLGGCTLTTKPVPETQPVTDIAMPVPTETPVQTDTGTTTSGTVISGTVTSGATTTVEIPDMVGYTLAEIATHKTKSDCWTAINGKVYDITSAFGKHKGGDDNLMTLCGIEGTANFEKQHGTNEKAKGRLAKLSIGILK